MKRPSSLQIILISLALAYIPHIFWLPVWVSVFCYFLWGFRFFIDARGLRKPSRSFIVILTFLTLLAALLIWGITLGLQGGALLLSLLLALKPYEIKTYRDKMITLFLGFFLLFTAVLFSEKLLTAVYVFTVACILCAALILIHQEKKNPVPALRRAVLLFIQSFPLALICFFLLPRLPAGSLLGVVQQTHTGTTGLSDSIAPGDISRLVQSSKVAFRAHFPGSIPEPEKRYWRALVLTDYDGRSWTRGTQADESNIVLQSFSRKTQYSLTMEPNGKKMLVALDLPLTFSSKAEIEPGFVLRSRDKLHKKFEYQVTSVLDYTTGPLTEFQRQQALSLDAQSNPKTRQLADKIMDQSSSKQEMITNILDYFRSHDFFYTFNPPRLKSDNPIDEFIFKTRKGYCEHYAQAAAWIMRCMGIPSRIVVGYQGGEYNPVGDYLMVRQSSAHAWTEVWLKSKGWQRLDPTSSVAPQRISGGMQTMGSTSQDSPILPGQGFGRILPGWHHLQMAWDALNYNWHKWVVSYSFSRQSRLLSGLDLGHNLLSTWSKLIFSALFSLFIFFSVLAILLLVPQGTKTDPVQKIYLQFKKKLSKAGILAGPHEGPMDISLRARRQRPEKGKEIQRICRLYVRLRYGYEPGKENLKMFRKAVRSFHP